MTYIVRSWHPRARACPISLTRDFDDLKSAREFFQGRHINVVRVDLEAWAFNPKRHKVLASRKAKS